MPKKNKIKYIKKLTLVAKNMGKIAIQWEFFYQKNISNGTAPKRLGNEEFIFNQKTLI